MRGGGGQRNDVGRGGRGDGEPLLRLRVRGQPFVMRVDHAGRVARLLRRQVLVAVEGVVVGAGRVAQAIRFSGQFQARAQFHNGAVKGQFVACPDGAGLARPPRLKPRGQGGAGFHNAALAGLGLAAGDLDMAGHAPHAGPVEAQQFGGAQPGESADGEQRAEGIVGGFKQAAELRRGVAGDLGRIRVLRAQTFRLTQAVRRGEVVLADGPLQGVAHGGAVVVASLGAECPERGHEGVQMGLGQVAKRSGGGTCRRTGGA